MCQGILNDLIDKMFSKSQDEMDESIDDSNYHVYKNVEFAIWRADQKKLRESSILSSLNESRDDSIDSSLYSSNQQVKGRRNDNSSI